MSPRRPLAAWIAALALFAGTAAAEDEVRVAADEFMPEGLAPEESLRAIRVRSGFEVELVAAEPLVRDPVAFDWSSDGRLWVVEMADYPLGVEGGGRVRVLEDADGDGRYDASTLFLDGLNYPNGVMPWRDGVLISSAPEILYAEDRDGDGRCDRVEVLYTGFAEANPQHRFNGFALGLDGWVHAADADGGEVRSTRADASVTVRGRDVRFRPDEGDIEAESGRSQFGRSRDDWGDWFINQNPVWAWHVVLSDADLRRNPAFAASTTTRLLEPDTRLYPASRTLARFNDPEAANRVTSACSPISYRDTLFESGFASSLFVSEPVHNLVHRMVLEPDGVTFVGRRADGEERAEFLSSADHWFRPTTIRTGPDGALWVADMQRAVIEHPEWIPGDWQERLDLRAGDDRGRIYRVFPSDRRPRPIPRLDRLDAPGLVAAIDSPNGWQRDTCQRLLMHRMDQAAIDPLRTLAASADRPEARVQALWTLACLNGLDADAVLRGLDDGHPEVRRAAILAGRALLPGDGGVGEAVLGLADDREPRVRLAATLALGDWPDPRAARALAEAARRDGGDSWVRAAVLSSSRPHAAAILASLLDGEGDGSAIDETLIAPLFATAASAAGAEGLGDLVRAVLGAIGEADRAGPSSLAILAGLLDEADRAGLPLARWGSDEVGLGRSAGAIATFFEEARRISGDERAPEAARVAAVRLLAREPGAVDRDLAALAELLGPREPAAIQRAAVDAVARLGDDRVPGLLLDGWRGHGPALRSAILDTMLARPSWRDALLDAIKAVRVPPAEVGPTHRARLLEHRVAEVRARAEALLGAVGGERGEVVEEHRRALARGGDPEIGRAVFRDACTPCHRLEGEGFEVGPDLATLTDRSPEALLVAILDPNRAVEARYAAYAVATTDGRVVSGLIAEESSNAVALLRQGGEREVLLRAEIDEITGSGRSLMPEGLEQDVDARELAHLIAYLRGLGARPKQVPGNAPALARPGADGAIALRAEAAEIFGNRLTFEPTRGNLGWWIQADDRAAWAFEADRAGHYEVWIEWACDDRDRGGAFAIEVGADRIAGTVAGTGSRDDYRRAKLGETTLGAGRHRLEIRPEGRPRGPLMDLRAIELVPASTEDEGR